MAKGFKSGGGGSNPLNFQVMGNPQPENPKENTIWLDTDIKITGYSFGTSEPAAPSDGKDGPVHVFTGPSSVAEFNALKKNGIQIYPISAKQFVSGAWVAVTAKIYQNGVWVEWWNGELYENGNEYTSITGGFVSVGKYLGNGTTPSAPTIVRNDDSIVFSGGCGIVHLKNKIDLTDYNTISFTGNIPNVSNANWVGFAIWPSVDFSDIFNGTKAASVGYNKTSFDLDISALSGEYYIGFWSYNQTITVTSLILS